MNQKTLFQLQVLSATGGDAKTVSQFVAICEKVFGDFNIETAPELLDYLVQNRIIKHLPSILEMLKDEENMGMPYFQRWVAQFFVL